MVKFTKPIIKWVGGKTQILEEVLKFQRKLMIIMKYLLVSFFNKLIIHID